MKSNISMIGSLIMALVMISVIAPPRIEGYDGTGNASEGDHFEWLILVYIAGDNDLGEDGEWGNAAVMDLDEMESSIPDSGVRVLALTDLLGPSNSNLYDIRPDNETGLNSPTIPLSDIDPAWTDELNMGDPSTLEKFIVYSLNNTDYDRSMFIMWDHGSGWLFDGDLSRPPATRGFAQDQYPQRTYMYLDGMRDAFVDVESAIGHFNFDIMAYDTCYMGMLEIFYQFSRWSDIAVGSMDEQPWYGYNYTFISSLEGKGPHEPEDLALEMIDLFEKDYSSSSHTYHTAVVADVKKLSGDFINSWDELSRSLHARMFHLEEERDGLFDNVVRRSESVGIDSVDVGSFLLELVERDIDENVTELAGYALNHYDKVILDSWIKPMGRNPRGTGITVYLPSKELAFKSQYDGSYGFLYLTADTFWDETLREYQDPVERIRMNLSVMETGTAGSGYGIKIEVSDTMVQPPAPIPDAEIRIDGEFWGVTDHKGTYIHDNISPGLYRVVCRSGDLVDIGTIKALNRPPVPLVMPINPSFGEGQSITIFGNESYDPDGDLLTYAWDLDESDGLDDVDSRNHSVTLKYDDDGLRIIRLTVNDSIVESRIDIELDVFNLPPVPVLRTPLTVEQDVIFTLDGSDSRDSPGDMPSLEYRFLIDSVIVRDWSADPLFNVSIGKPGTSDVSMDVRDKDGGVSGQTVTINVRNLPPVSVISGPSEIREDEVAVYSGKDSTDSDSDIERLRYRWFLDGSEDPVGYERNLSLSFRERGTHILELTVFDGEPGAFLTLSDRTAIEIIVNNVDPVAVITGADRGNESEILFLDASSSVDTPSDMDDLNYLWDIKGDGNFDVQAMNISVNYTSPGKKRVSLMVIDDDGASSIRDHYIDIVNIHPSPAFQLPEMGEEDEFQKIEIKGTWDTVNDIPSLVVRWYLDDTEFSTAMDPGGIIIETSGQHRVEVVVTDDQGATNSFARLINITNPIPQVILSGVPKRVLVGEEFTALGYGTIDNPSDMNSLVFIWYLDGEKLDITSMNATFRFDSPGERTIELEVRDDDGDGSRAILVVSVEEESLFVRLIDLLFSVVGLVMLLVLFVILFGLIYQVNSKVRDLDPPERVDKDHHGKDDLEEEVQSENTRKGPVGSGDLENEDEGISSPEAKESVTGSYVADLPSISPIDLPGPPLIDCAEVPDPEDDLFELVPSHSIIS